MNIKRYDSQKFIAGMFVIAEKSDGKYVLHSDYAALEQQLAESQREFRAADATIENLQMQVEKLAAENAGLKSVEVWMNADEIGGSAADKAIENGATPEEATRAGVQAVIDSIKTPVTDSVLAEVQAKGVDAAIEHLHKKFEGTGRIGVPVMALEWLAKSMREGAAS